jgi:hypothetical protein
MVLYGPCWNFSFSLVLESGNESTMLECQESILQNSSCCVTFAQTYRDTTLHGPDQDTKNKNRCVWQFTSRSYYSTVEYTHIQNYSTTTYSTVSWYIGCAEPKHGQWRNTQTHTHTHKMSNTVCSRTRRKCAKATSYFIVRLLGIHKTDAARYMRHWTFFNYC